ncbi:formate dehydrogenase accessory sulfurtransferase FdhD [Hymenobacter weizhouensis]|uniref:formate dehydrogenase accessory sulfurtransferase FdhD n=1 Tax=Hymenobacter sp. YIM 151500-1 TaxID=2987689 RepID=UPI002227102A|nr:formate dehydrogenase accessory sulfurtransferase FdhD [Hymenobacter sp. YIM 151500-1]UYZ62342.1 formate dehydrogenase accessory sulfurtransferase FdhD [Hymenobacter sp. YIM 151500-1]
MDILLPPTSYDYVTVQRVQGQDVATASDVLAAEEPLEIRVGYGPAGQRQHRTLSITMRTPGHDFELAAGFLFTEGIIRGRQDLTGVIYCADVEKEEERENVVRAELAVGAAVDLPRLERHFYTSSSCGVCGKTSIEAVHASACPVLPAAGPHVAASVIHQLPERQRAAQALFEQTGGLHASALFSPAGELLLLREDVGRHNALDKVIGAALLQEQLPLHNAVLLVSGRASFELVQKAAVAGIPVLAAVGAPSSLAVQAAHDFGMTLCGFVRQNRYNIYTHPWRITEK